MKHLGFVGKSTEYLGYTHVEIINSSIRLSFNIPSTKDLEEPLKRWSKITMIYSWKHQQKSSSN